MRPVAVWMRASGCSTVGGRHVRRGRESGLGRADGIEGRVMFGPSSLDGAQQVARQFVIRLVHIEKVGGSAGRWCDPHVKQAAPRRYLTVRIVGVPAKRFGLHPLTIVLRRGVEVSVQVRLVIDNQDLGRQVAFDHHVRRYPTCLHFLQFTEDPTRPEMVFDLQPLPPPQ